MMIRDFYSCAFFMIFMIYSQAQAQPYFSEHQQGWHWYRDYLQKKKPELPHQKMRPISIEDELKEIQQRIDTAQKKMVLHPTEKNVRHFIVLQHQLMAQTDKLTRAWKQVLLKYPDLDYNVSHPTSTLGLNIARAEQQKKEDQAIHRLSQQSGLFFFYRSTCPYCRGFAPTVKAFADHYQVKVIPVTTDGVSLPEFPHSYTDQGQAKKFHVRAEPALFAVNPYTQRAYPIAYGLISYDELRRKVLDVAHIAVQRIKT